MATLIGTLTVGANTDFFATGDAVVSPYVCSASGTLDTLSVPITASAFTTLRLCVYADSAGAPAGLLGQTVTTSDTTAGTKSLAMVSNVSLTSGVTYWLGLLPLGGDTNLVDAAGSYRGNIGNAALPDPFGTSTFSDPTFAVPIQGTGTAGAGAAPALGFTPNRMPLGV